MGLAIKNDTKGLFMAAADLTGTDAVDDTIIAATVATQADLDSATGGSEVCFALCDRMHSAVTAHNADAGETDLANFTTRLVNSASGDDLVKTYTFTFILGASAGNLDVKAE